MRPRNDLLRALPVARRGAAVRGTLALALLFVVLSSQAPVALAQSSGSSSGLTPTEANALRINTVLFDATVPNVVYLGQNFSVSVQLTNVSNESIPVVVELSTPVEMLYVTPHVHKDYIPPGAQVTETFWMVPIQATDNAQNVTARVWIWFQDRMSEPALVIRATTLVFGIRPSPLAPYVAGAIGGTAFAVLVAAAFLLRRRSRLGREAGRSPEAEPTGLRASACRTG